MAQSNSLLAASLILPDKPCAKLTGMGGVILIQQCKQETAFLTYKETRCGIEPILKNTDNPPFTLSRDGMAAYPFSECFWPNGIINVNGKPHEFINGSWIERNHTVHLKHLKLMKKFPEIHSKAIDYLLNPRQVYDNKAWDQSNVLAELVARIQMTNTNSLDSVVLTESSTSNFWDISDWMSKLKIIMFTVIGVLGTAMTVAIAVKILPLKALLSLRKKKQESPIDQIEQVELIPKAGGSSVPEHTARPNNEAIRNIDRNINEERHDHQETFYVRGIGLLWKNCNCLAVGIMPEHMIKGN